MAQGNFLICPETLIYRSENYFQVAEQLVNPFGDDSDDDFDVCSIVDSSLLISYLSVDKVHEEPDIILKDVNFGEFPCSLQDMDNTSKDKSKKDSSNTELHFQNISMSQQNYKALLQDLKNIENGKDDPEECTELLELGSCKFGKELDD